MTSFAASAAASLRSQPPYFLLFTLPCKNEIAKRREEASYLKTKQNGRGNNAFEESSSTLKQMEKVFIAFHGQWSTLYRLEGPLKPQHDDKTK